MESGTNSRQPGEEGGPINNDEAKSIRPYTDRDDLPTDDFLAGRKSMDADHCAHAHAGSEDDDFNNQVHASSSEGGYTGSTSRGDQGNENSRREPPSNQYSYSWQTPSTTRPVAERKPGIFTFRRLFRDIIIPLVIAFGVAMFVQATVAKPYKIPSGSMLPTIKLNDRILTDRLVYHFKDIQRGDIIVFEPPANQAGAEPGVPFVKRVVGLPGDTVEVLGGKTLVNGEEQVVPEADRPIYTRQKEVVPDGMLFVLGDNRNESSDSHIWGYVPVENVIGRVELIYWPPKHMSFI